VNLQAIKTLPIDPPAPLAVGCDAGLGGMICGKPLMKGGSYEILKSAQAQTEPTLPDSQSAPVTMYVHERMAGLNAMPPNDQADLPPTRARGPRSGTKGAIGG
jgi:hypothetical protein